MIRIGKLCALLLVCSLAAAIGCGDGSGSAGSGGGVVELSGSGASFPAPLYQRWMKEFSDANDNVKVEYASKGSGAGIKEFTAGLTDFGASDAAMSDEEIEAVGKGVQLLPMTAGSIVLCYNLDDADGNPVEGLKLSRDAYTGIFLGTVTRWNDPAIAEANPGVNLPEKEISVVCRSDSSGTTYVFTQHLAEISEEFKKEPGVGKAVTWPTGSGAPKNDGVAGAVKNNPGSIGYVEFGFADFNKLTMAHLENAAGKFVEPSFESAQAALAGVKDMPENLRIWLPDPEAEDAYPIVTYTWMLFYTEYPEEKLTAIKNMLNYCLDEGQKSSKEMGYIPLPENVIEKVKAAMKNIKPAGGDEA